MFDNIKNQVMSAALGDNGKILAMATQLVSDNGGIQGLISKFQSAGMSDIVSSWLGNGANLPITAEQITKVLGNPQIQALSSKFGIDPNKAAGQLAEGLPKIMDKLSSNGEMPNIADLSSKLGDLKGLFS